MYSVLEPSSSAWLDSDLFDLLLLVFDLLGLDLVDVCLLSLDLLDEGRGSLSLRDLVA